MKKKLMIKNKLGLHARAAALFVQTANKHESEILVKAVGGNRRVNGKSIMGVMMIAAAYNQEILIEAKGKDEREALEELTVLIESKFNEE
ncbi:MAG: HPr family phosphocarrier protein [bacterium]